MPLLVLTAVLLKQGQVIDFIVQRISPELERQIGAASLAQVRATTRFIEQGAAAQALAAVARQVVGDDTASYRFHLADDKRVNAFAVPGGDIVVNRGLLAATRSPEELAGVLAHEIQHLALRHSLQGVARACRCCSPW